MKVSNVILAVMWAIFTLFLIVAGVACAIFGENTEQKLGGLAACFATAAGFAVFTINDIRNFMKD